MVIFVVANLLKNKKIKKLKKKKNWFLTLLNAWNFSWI
jgi:hypothetical protein